MLFQTLTKDAFAAFLDGIIAANETIAPRVVDHDAAGRPVYQFQRVRALDEMALDCPVTYSSLKHFFLPFVEPLSTFAFEGAAWRQQIAYEVHPRVIVGLRAFDIHGLLKLDKVLMQEKFPLAGYIARRKNTFLIGMDHEPPADCFAESLNADVALHGFDLFVTDIGDRYFLRINSSNAFNLLKNVATREITPEDERLYVAAKKRLKRQYRTRVQTTDLPSLMDIEFESDVWQRWGAKCLSCGTCAMVCPTCYCYTVEERLAPSLKTAVKEKRLYACNLVDFAEVAGGHNFRATAASRLKYRFYHQHRGFVESYDEPKCVGCNRCGRACPAGINPVDVIQDLVMEGAP